MPNSSFFFPKKRVRAVERQHQIQPPLPVPRMPVPRITISLISIVSLQQQIFEIILVMEKNCSDLQEIKNDYQSVLDILKGLRCEQGKMQKLERAAYKIDAQIKHYETLRDHLSQEITKIQQSIEAPILSICAARLQKQLEQFQAIARRDQDGHGLEAELTTQFLSQTAALR